MSLKTKGNRDRIGGGYQIRIGGHLMPENPGVTHLLKLPNAGIGYGVRMGLSNLLPHGRRSHPQPQGLLYLNLFI